VAPGEHSPQTLRQYGLGAQILSTLGLSAITLVTNSAAPRFVGLDAYGLTIAGTCPIKE
jgi:3,4-dihydroxy 2-butanone 4-phosphate synthase/GTP cyclohydrolase II